MSEIQTISRRFTNRGLVLKKAADLLDEGEFYGLENCASIQEGSIGSRVGHRQVNITETNSNVHSLAKLHVSADDDSNPRYIGYGSSVVRTTDGVNLAHSVGLPSGEPWGFEDYKSGAGADAIGYFATRAGMFLDRGGVSDAFRRWGIPTPPVPVIAVPGAFDLAGAGVIPASLTPFTARFATKNVSSVSSGTGYIMVAPDDMNGIVSGMLLYIGSEACVVEKAEETRFYVVCTSPHSVGETITSSYRSISTIADLVSVDGVWGLTIDASFDGSSDTGYDSDDIVHVSLYCSDPDGIEEVSIRMAPAAPGPDFTPDYYEATIPGSDLRADAWTEFDIPKTAFTKVGSAGSGLYTWKNITAAYVSVTGSGSVEYTDDMSAWTQVRVGQMYIAGGKGPGKAGGYAIPYRWVYTYRNPLTGEEGNPSMLMTDISAMGRAKRQAFTLTLTGFSNAAYSGYEDFTGQGSIVVYRSGGPFADAYYRRIASISNPGSWSTVEFVDNVSDYMLRNAAIAEFDNDQPVSSTLPVALQADISSYNGGDVGGPGGITTIALTNLPDDFGALSSRLTIGSSVFVGTGTTAEQVVIVGFPSSTSFQAYLQNWHATTTNDSSETVSCGHVVGAPCDIVACAHDSIFLAGDENNPHVLYRSKTGKPHAFPLQNLATGNVHQVNVGSPANPIKGIAEWSGEIVSLNLSKFYIVRVFMGRMEEPLECPVSHGLAVKHAWCKGDNALYYLSYDGIYAWAGSSEVKISEPITSMFEGITTNGTAPIDMDQKDKIRLAYSRFNLYVVFVDTDGNYRRLRYETLYNRWYIDYVCDTDGTELDFVLCYSERDTGDAVFAVMHPNRVWSRLWIPDWATTSDNGTAIRYKAHFYSPLGQPPLDMLVRDVVIELTNPFDDVDVEFYTNYLSTIPDPTTISASGSLSRLRIPFPLNSGYGRECYAYGLSVSGSTTQGVTFHSISLRASSLQEVQRGGPYDWDDLGHQYDKKLRLVTLEYETEAAVSETVHLDTLTGISGNTSNVAAASFSIQGAKGKQTFAIPDSVLPVKMVKVRPATATVNFKLWKYYFQFDPYPPDFCPATDFEDGGSPYDKYWQQVLLDVDTGGVAASVVLEVDGVDQQTLSVTTTATDRMRVLTLNPGIIGKKARLKPTPGSGGKFQKFAHSYIALPADKGPVFHTYDWDALGHLHDKRLVTCTIEYEVSADTTMVLYGLSGIAGYQSSATITSVALKSGGRRFETVAMPNNTVVKMIRWQASATNIVFKAWKYEFEKETYPPDAVPATPISEHGYPYEKIFQALEITLDTGNVACLLQIEVDGTVQHSANVTTTATDRTRILSIPSDVIGKVARVIPTPGTAGKAQIFEYHFIYQKEPPYLTHWDSSEQAFGYNGWKFQKQCWLEYMCADAVTLTIQRDDGATFYTKSLPRHATRAVERFYLPAVHSGALNKSKVYRYKLDATVATVPFKLYPDGSRIEIMLLAGDQRAGYTQHPLSAGMPLLQ